MFRLVRRLLSLYSCSLAQRDLCRYIWEAITMLISCMCVEATRVLERTESGMTNFERSTGGGDDAPVDPSSPVVCER